jgi:hypothetical protein
VDGGGLGKGAAVKRGQIFVRAKNADGRVESADVLDLDEESFRVFVLDVLMRNGLVTSLKHEYVEGEHIEYKLRT